MHALAAEDLLALWEIGAGLHAIDRSLQVLARAGPDGDPEALARLPLGSRDVLLLEVRRQTLGDRLEAQDVCPACGQRIEVALQCSALAAACGEPPPQWSIEYGGCRLQLRPLDSVDAAAAAQCGSARDARAVLLARSVVAAERDGRPVPPGDLPPDVLAEVEASIAAQDGGAELVIALACPACARTWRNVLDVASFVWAELAAHAQRLLLDVHALARAYGWSQAEILGMSDRRRAAYLALAAP
jgi:hypothetical protein